ncbi:hypothetical protein ACLB2K_072003 [Fragaria x ananassa]
MHCRVPRELEIKIPRGHRISRGIRIFWTKSSSRAAGPRHPSWVKKATGIGPNATQNLSRVLGRKCPLGSNRDVDYTFDRNGRLPNCFHLGYGGLGKDHSCKEGGFPVNEETNSRIIHTTRNEELASIAKENGLSYESHALSVDDAWSLFQKIAFSEADETDSQIKLKKEELGKKMLCHCAGLPLAIIVLAGLLSKKDTVNDWETVSENVNVYIRRGTDLDREYKEKLPHLRVLYLQDRVFSSLPSDTLVCTNGGFPNLEFLYLEGLRELKEWRVEEGGMPRLRRLYITRCDELRAVPDGLQYVTALKELTFKSMPIEFCERLEENGDDFHKIKHVPFLTITGTSTRRGWGKLRKLSEVGHGTTRN